MCKTMVATRKSREATSKTTQVMRNARQAMGKTTGATQKAMGATRAAGAKDYSLGQHPRYIATKLFTRYRRSSSRRRYLHEHIHNKYRVYLVNGKHILFLLSNAYGYCCACSAH